MITGKSIIGQSWSTNESKTFKTFDPIKNEENEWTFCEASAAEIEEACTLANDAFKTFRTSSNQKRANFLRTIAQEMEALGDDLLGVYQKESGLPVGRANGELRRTCLLYTSPSPRDA